MTDDRNKCVLSRFLKMDNQSVVVDRILDGKLFHAARPATQNARFPKCRLDAAAAAAAHDADTDDGGVTQLVERTMIKYLSKSKSNLLKFYLSNK